MLKIDKSNWTNVKLSDVVFKTENNDKLNAKKIYQKFIKAEHLDAESLNIQKFGNQETDELPPTFYKIFKKGQILYPTRNPHLRRAALANFDGICGEKTLTLSIDENVADIRFVAFLFHSNSFYTHTTNCIVGSTNPHVRWRDVANYEFLLPPKNQQAELADLLWAMDDVIEKDLVVLKKAELFKSSKLEYILFDSNNPKVTLKNYIYEKKNISIPPHKIKKYIGLEHLISGRNEINGYDSSSNVLSNCFKIEEGDLCYSKLRPYLDKAVIADFECVATTELIILDSVQLSKRTILEILHSTRFLAYIKDKGYGTKMPRVNFNIIGEFDFNLPKDIDSVEKIVINFDNAINLLREKLQSSKTLQKSLINQIF